MEKKNIRPVSGFTLVELIVVITILAILGTIAIMAFSGYSKNARDSARVSDISRITSSVELFQVAKGFFPEPTNGIPVTYSGATAWTQGTFGDSTVINVEKLSKKPVDPLTGSEYAYSITQSKKEFQIGGIYEGDSIASVVNQTYAAEAGKALVKGNYNGSILKVQSGSTTFVLAVPTILASDLDNGTDVEVLISNQRLVFDKYNNLPASYKGTSYELNGGFGFEPGTGSIVVFSGDTSSLKTGTGQKDFVDKLQAIYAGTVIESTPEIANILSYDTVNDTGGTQLLAQVLINGYVDSSVAINSNTPVGGGEENNGPVVCTSEENSVFDVLNSLLSNGDISAQDAEWNGLPGPLTKEEWCSVYSLQWVGGSNIPNEIFSLNSLGVLVLESNGITTLSTKIGNLTNLNYLSISGNQLTTLPSEIGNLTNLQTFYLDSNQLTTLPPEIGNLSSLQSIGLNNNQLIAIPSEIGNLTNLIGLGISYNQLTSLPSEIGNLTNLQVLGLGGNLWTTFPSQIWNLINLTQLGLGDSPLVPIPPQISNLTNLMFLGLNGNQLTTLPSEIGNLTSLTQLDVTYNQLTTIPSPILNLVNLSVLFLYSNQLTNIPSQISNLTQLQLLFLSNNPSLGNLSYDFMQNTPNRTQGGMTIGGNGAKIVISGNF